MLATSQLTEACALDGVPDYSLFRTVPRQPGVSHEDGAVLVVRVTKKLLRVVGADGGG